MPFLNPSLGIDFSNYIADRTLNFTGREWVFETIQNWLADPEGDETVRSEYSNHSFLVSIFIIANSLFFIFN